MNPQNTNIWLVIALSLLGGCSGEILRRVINILKRVNDKMKHKKITIITTQAAIIEYLLKYLVPLGAVCFLMFSDAPLNKLFVLAMSISFSVVIISIIRDTALYYLNYYARLKGID